MRSGDDEVEKLVGEHGCGRKYSMSYWVTERDAHLNVFGLEEPLLLALCVSPLLPSQLARWPSFLAGTQSRQ